MVLYWLTWLWLPGSPIGCHQAGEQGEGSGIIQWYHSVWIWRPKNWVMMHSRTYKQQCDQSEFEYPGIRSANVWRQDKMESSAEERMNSSFPSPFFFCQDFKRLENTHPRYWRWYSLLSSLIQMLISSRDTLPDTSRKSVYLLSACCSAQSM